ncbi:hypothetical protein FA15DRAFT_663056 [Coprinopsis marcescibilis]|uniref:Uncharacterized protein n=1 Tax=Coprinopsis marcescibilis TaxID=230819 RepID=A0A5C3LM58_COPMA|nr:hypothetical protein FA15DRAFT_663056 [Coprinopsis marcescibilis]
MKTSILASFSAIALYVASPALCAPLQLHGAVGQPLPISQLSLSHSHMREDNTAQRSRKLRRLVATKGMSQRQRERAARYQELVERDPHMWGLLFRGYQPLMNRIVREATGRRKRDLADVGLSDDLLERELVSSGSTDIDVREMLAYLDAMD